tara:strand:- start:1040 stop:1720 length:681 start_codon:yes stop_codon:yes gene_type:complete
MSIRTALLSVSLCLIFAVIGCSSDALSEYPSKDYDKSERTIDRESREAEKQRRDNERLDQEAERQRRDAERADHEAERRHRDAEYKENQEKREHHNREREAHHYESKPPRDMKMASGLLGIAPEALREALGGPPPDIQKGSKILGISEEKLMEALGIQGYPDKHDDHERHHENSLKSAAEKLGVDLKELQDALGPPPPDVEAAARKLGIQAEKIREAMAIPTNLEK